MKKKASFLHLMKLVIWLNSKLFPLFWDAQQQEKKTHSSGEGCKRMKSWELKSEWKEWKICKFDFSFYFSCAVFSFCFHSLAVCSVFAKAGCEALRMNEAKHWEWKLLTSSYIFPSFSWNQRRFWFSFFSSLSFFRRLSTFFFLLHPVCVSLNEIV